MHNHNGRVLGRGSLLHEATWFTVLSWWRDKEMFFWHRMKKSSVRMTRLVTSRNQARSQFSTFFPFVDKP